MNPFDGLTELPDGYHEVAVLFTTKELESLRREASLQPYGTYSEVVREQMGLHGFPYGLITKLRRRKMGE